MTDSGDPLGDYARLSIPELREAARHVTFYHSLDLGEGVETVGDFDIRPQIHHYGFPEDMTGMSVLDIGRASGYFSFEFERRGARVCATELPSPLGKDHVGQELGKDHVGQEYGEAVHRGKYSATEVASLETGKGARVDFPIAHRILGSRLESVYVSAYEISPERLGGRRFDLVFMGSLLCHLANPIAALTAARSVCRGEIVICNPIDPGLDQTKPHAAFVGRLAKGLTTWWIPTVACLAELLAATGFSDVEVVAERIDLDMPKAKTTMPHCVLRARNDRSPEEMIRHFAAIHAGERPAPAYQSHRSTPKENRRRWLNR